MQLKMQHAIYFKNQVWLNNINFGKIWSTINKILNEQQYTTPISKVQ